MGSPAKTAKHSLGFEAVTLTVSKLLTMMIGMVISMLLARFRTLEEYGTYSQMLLVIDLACALLMLGLPNCINYFLSRAETDAERQHFLSVYYTLSSLLSLGIGGVLVLSIPLAEAYFQNPAIRQFYYYLALTPWTMSIMSTIENVLIIYHKTRFLIFYRLVTVVLNLIMIASLQWLGYGFRAYMTGTVVLNGLTALSVYAIAAAQCGGLRLRLDASLIRKMLAFCLPLGLSGIVGTLCIELDKLMIGKLMTTEQMAIYTNAAKELPLTIIPSSITAVLMPKLVVMIKHRQEQDAVRLWGTAAELAFMFMAFLTSGLFTYAEDVVTLLYSEKYLAGVNVFRVYTLNLLMRCTYFGIILNACGKSKTILTCGILSLVFNVILNPLLYLFFGMEGPAAATFLAILAVTLTQLIFTARLTRTPFAKIFPWKGFAVILLWNAAFGILFYSIKAILPLDQMVGSIAESMMLGVVWGITYLLVMRKRITSSWNHLNEKET